MSLTKISKAAFIRHLKHTTCLKLLAVNWGKPFPTGTIDPQVMGQEFLDSLPNLPEIVKDSVPGTVSVYSTYFERIFTKDGNIKRSCLYFDKKGMTVYQEGNLYLVATIESLGRGESTLSLVLYEALAATSEAQA